jgi:hypothetical protein
MKKVSIRHHKNLVYKEVDETIHILDLTTGVVETLNPTASFIWKQLESPITIETLIRKLCIEFAVTPKKAKPDVVRFIEEQLAKNHLKKT